MCYHSKSFYLFFLITCFSNSLASELVDDFSELDSLSLEQLLNVEIGVASKSDESLWEAPSIVSVITKQEIEQWGGVQLGDYLERVPGFLGISSFILPQNAFSARGDYPGHTNPHILFLIDGSPVRDSILGGFNADIISSFPISSVERIEVIRGPGSVLYGTNAYVGVVNIVTRRPETDGYQASIRYGSFEGLQSQFSVDKTIGTVHFSSDFSFFKEDGWDLNSQFAEDQGIVQSYEENLFSGRLTLDTPYFTVNSFYAQNIHSQVTSTGAPGDGKNQRLFLDVKKTFQVNNHWKLDVSVSNNQVSNILPTGPNIQARPKSNDIVSELTNFINLTDTIKITAGASYYRLKGEWNMTGVSIIPNYQESWYALYGQLDWRVRDNLKLVAGAQWNKPQGQASHGVPRFGAIYNLNALWGAKLLYGEAFRASFPGETLIAIPRTLRGTPNLTPEKIATYDAQVFFKNEETEVSLTYFDSHQDNLITRIPSSDPAFRLEFTNQGALDSSGLEFEFKWIPTETFLIMGSLTQTESETDQGIDNPSLVPETQAKLGLSYQHSASGLTIALFNTYHSKPKSLLGGSSQTAYLNPEPESAHLTTANFSWRLPQARSSKVQWRLNMYGSNLFDQGQDYPEFVFRRVNTLPNRAGRSFYGMIQVQF